MLDFMSIFFKDVIAVTLDFIDFLYLYVRILKIFPFFIKKINIKYKIYIYINREIIFDILT